MSKEQIDEMARVIAEVQYLGGLEQKVAQLLFEKGYRKQSEGEWIAEKSITESKRGRTIHSTVYRCSLCDAPNGRKKDHFCRWCGASMVASMMKGGAE